MTLKAYQKTQVTVETSRNTEYRLFGQVTGALLEAQKVAAKGAPLIDAVDWNRQLWSALASDCLDDANKLPKELRAQIVSLSLWVAKYSREVTRAGASVEPLIEINRSIMQGLNAA
jgi:flagellar protein FlaF